MDTVQRYPTVGGFSAWWIPCLFGPSAFVAELVGEWVLAGFIVAVAAAVWWVEHAFVIEVSPAGLARGLAVGGKLLGPARVIAWPAVAEVATRWREPRDFTALDTVVTGRDGEEVRFSTQMGLGPYRALLTQVSRRAHRARRTGLTEQFLAEPPLQARHLARRVGVAAAALGFVALLAIVAWG